MILDALLDALLDTVKTVPFLLIAFLILEALEHYSNNYMNRALGKMGKAGAAGGSHLRLRTSVRFLGDGGQSLFRWRHYPGNPDGRISLYLR